MKDKRLQIKTKRLQLKIAALEAELEHGCINPDGWQHSLLYCVTQCNKCGRLVRLSQQNKPISPE